MLNGNDSALDVFTSGISFISIEKEALPEENDETGQKMQWGEICI